MLFLPVMHYVPPKLTKLGGFNSQFEQLETLVAWGFTRTSTYGEYYHIITDVSTSSSSSPVNGPTNPLLQAVHAPLASLPVMCRG